MTGKRNLFIGLATSALLIVLTIPGKGLDEILILYFPFDSDTDRVATDITGKTKGGNIIGKGSSGDARQGLVTRW